MTIPTFLHWAGSVGTVSLSLRTCQEPQHTQEPLSYSRAVHTQAPPREALAEPSRETSPQGHLLSSASASLPQAPCPGRFFISGSRLGCPWTRTILSPPAIWVMHLIRGVSSPRGPFIGLFVYVRPPPGSGHLGKPTLPTVRQVLVMETWN